MHHQHVVDIAKMVNTGEDMKGEYTLASSQQVHRDLFLKPIFFYYTEMDPLHTQDQTEIELRIYAQVQSVKLKTSVSYHSNGINSPNGLLVQSLIFAI